MKIDIEKYLNDEMSPEERARFERKLERNPELRAEVEAERAFLDRLKTQLLREKIAAALADGGEDHPPEKTTGKSWIWLLGLLLLATVAAFWVIGWYGNEQPDPAAPDPPVEMQQTPEVQEVAPMPAEEDAPPSAPAQEQKPARPIAENPTVPPHANQPGVRGEEIEPGDWGKLVESVWVTRFEPKTGEYGERFAPVADLLKAKKFTDAFVQLTLLERQAPGNDTLAFLKGYCLLEMREGEEALRYFGKLEKGNLWGEEVEWFSLLAHLLAGERERALNAAEKIAGRRGHRYRAKAEKVVEKLK